VGQTLSSVNPAISAIVPNSAPRSLRIIVNPAADIGNTVDDIASAAVIENGSVKDGKRHYRNRDDLAIAHCGRFHITSRDRGSAGRNS
jgi:hypothetical protein